jgi:hypothetical protein
LSPSESKNTLSYKRKKKKKKAVRVIKNVLPPMLAQEEGRVLPAIREEMVLAFFFVGCETRECVFRFNFVPAQKRNPLDEATQPLPPHATTKITNFLFWRKDFLMLATAPAMRNPTRRQVIIGNPPARVPVRKATQTKRQEIVKMPPALALK